LFQYEEEDGTVHSVDSADVKLATERDRGTFDPARAQLPAMTAAVEVAGSDAVESMVALQQVMVVARGKDSRLGATARAQLALRITSSDAALTASEWAYILENGRIAMSGPSAQLLADPKVQEAYLGMAQRACAHARGAIDRGGVCGV